MGFSRKGTRVTTSQLAATQEEAAAVISEARRVHQEAVAVLKGQQANAELLFEQTRAVQSLFANFAIISTMALEGLGKLPEQAAVGPVMLQEFAKQMPQWSLSTGIAQGETVKTFRRSMTDMSHAMYQDRNVWLSLWDSEYSDGQLCEIFGVFNLSGDDTTYHPHIEVNLPGTGAITEKDLQMIMKAEAYLLESGIVIAPVQQAN